MIKLSHQAPSSGSPHDYKDPVYTGVPTNSIAEDESSPQWDDTFFDDDEDIIEVFDFDYPLIEDFVVKSRLVTLTFSLLYCEILILVEELILSFPLRTFMVCAFITAVAHSAQLCFLRRNVRWEVYSQHLCVTRDGIRFVKDKRKSGVGWACTDKGKTSKTVPFDQITDCDIQEPAGNTCIFVTNVFSTVKVDTASSGGRNANGITVPELAITGLKDPYRFKKLVWAMKRSTAANATFDQVAAPVLQITQSNEVSQLLKEIRNVLQEQTQMLQKNALKESEMV